ncbi:MAG: hypothetical protein DRR16_03845 [Candidatus Parabeggiatoa sp. nov. 3]|nr:MAG: hypothetical protein DRR00_05650 [Gammaproteobacteria bacterium]RKZ88905.1 MAG: hypothetical protein DRR16_03845 [Gammaproteobacteria bacterium]
MIFKFKWWATKTRYPPYIFIFKWWATKTRYRPPTFLNLNGGQQKHVTHHFTQMFLRAKTFA